MSMALSLDLRQRVVAAVRDEGLSHRAGRSALQGECRQHQPVAGAGAAVRRAAAWPAGWRSAQPGH